MPISGRLMYHGDPPESHTGARNREETEDILHVPKGRILEGNNFERC